MKHLNKEQFNKIIYSKTSKGFAEIIDKYLENNNKNVNKTTKEMFFDGSLMAITYWFWYNNELEELEKVFTVLGVCGMPQSAYISIKIVFGFLCALRNDNLSKEEVFYYSTQLSTAMTKEMYF
jgi:hypothetical protein